MYRKSILFAIGTALVCILTTASANAQVTSVFATGLQGPSKIVITPWGNLLVAESGGAPNTGRVSIVDQFGTRRTLIEGLPSGISAEGGGPSGPQGLDLRGRTLFVAIGEGDGTLAGPIPGTEVPNSNPSSPILSSVLAIPSLQTPIAWRTLRLGGFAS